MSVYIVVHRPASVMADVPLFWTVGALLMIYTVRETAAFEARITKPVGCNRKDERFHRGFQYSYLYSALAETGVPGTSASKSASRLDCGVVVEARRKCEGYLNVTYCSLYHRQPGPEEQYVRDEIVSAEISGLLSKELYFQFDRGSIRPHTIVVDNVETKDVLNIKRGILSALQLKILTEAPSSEIHSIETEDIIGICPTEYVMSEPDTVTTYRDITQCLVPHHSYHQANLRSFIKKVYGGYLQGHIDDVIYPFNSTIQCSHILGENHKLIETKCLQQHIHRPFAHHGSILASYMANISQHLVLQETRDLAASNINRKMRCKRSGSLTYEFEDEDADGVIHVTKDDIIQWLQKITAALNTDAKETIPQTFQDFLWLLRQSQANDLVEVMAAVWSCHGNQATCDEKEKGREQDYYLDALLSCGTDACLSVFTEAIKAGHMTRWMQYVFVYDLALHHEPAPLVLTTMLEMCKERNRGGCWFPLSVMVNKMAAVGGSLLYQDSGPVYQTLLYIRESLGDICQTGIPTTQSPGEASQTVYKVLLMLKAIGNIGDAVQFVFDSKYAGVDEDRRIIHTVLRCAENANLPHKVSKAAILALHKMSFTQEIKDVLLGILGDVNRSPSSRTTVFTHLVMVPDPSLAAILHEAIRTERMEYMKDYMISYVSSLLQNDQPDLENLREIWKELGRDSDVYYPRNKHRIGQSTYVEISRYIKFPLRAEFYGFQLEIDTVYNVASPVVNAIVLRVNYYASKKINLVELAVDIDDMDILLDAIIKKNPGILFRLFMMSQSQRSFDSPGDTFATFQQDVVAAILELFSEINISQLDVPDGVIYVKVSGHEVFFVDVRDLVMGVMQTMGRARNPAGTIITYLQLFLESLPLSRTRSSSPLDVVHLLPTIGGFTLNMTAGVVTSMGLDVDAKLIMPDLSSLKTNIQLDAYLSPYAAVQFRSHLTTKFGRHALSGASFRVRGLLQMSNTFSLGYNTHTMAPTVVEISGTRANTDSTYTIGHLRGDLYLLHKSGEETISGDPTVEKTVQNCDRRFVYNLFRNDVCFTAVYPDTSDSDTHAYFPMSGPFDFSLDMRRVDIDDYHLSLVVTKGPASHETEVWLNMTRQGQNSVTDGFIFHIVHQRYHLGLVQLQIPDAQIDYYVKLMYDKSSSSENRQSVLNVGLDLHLSKEGRSLNRFQVKFVGLEQKFDLADGTESRWKENTVVVIVAIPCASLQVAVAGFVNTSAHHYKTSCNVTYHCDKACPLLYLLHLNPSLAAQNGDITKVMVVNDIVYGYNHAETDEWAMNDKLVIIYPGQRISLVNEMDSNVTNARRHTLITYIGTSGLEHAVVMDAHVTNSSNETYSNYDYFMVLSHSSMPFKLSLQGHLRGSAPNIEIHTEIVPLRNSEQVVMVTDSDPDRMTGEVSIDRPDGRSCRSLDEMKITMAVEGVPSLKGIEMRWEFNYKRPTCSGQVHYHANGVYGRQKVNTRRHFHHWFHVDAIATEIVEAEGDQAALSKSKSYSGGFRLHFHKYRELNFHVEYNSCLLNMSQTLHYISRRLKRAPLLLLESFVQTPWPALNLHVKHQFNRTSHRWGLPYEFVVQSPWVDGYSVITYNDSDSANDEFRQRGHLVTNLPWLRGRTNITTTFLASNDVLPQLLIVLEHMDGTTTIKADMVNNTLNIITVNYQETGEDAVHVLTWEMALKSHRASTHTVSWNPDLAQVIYQDISGSLHTVRTALVQAGDIAQANTYKPLKHRVFVFSDSLTIGSFLETNVYPYMWFPNLGQHRTGADNPTSEQGTGSESGADNPTSDQGTDSESRADNPTEQRTGSESGAYNPYHTGSERPSLGWVLWAKVFSTTLKTLGGARLQPHWIVRRILDKFVRPRLQTVLKDARVTFTHPLLWRWEGFLDSPKLNYGGKYMSGLARRIFHQIKVTNRYSTGWKHKADAIIYDRQYLVTYHLKVYRIPDDHAADCVHLLAADFKHQTFAVLVSRQGISILTSEMAVMVEYGGNVFINNCPQPVDLPVGQSGGPITVKMKNDDMIVDTKYGVRVICRHAQEICSIHLLSGQFAQSWGLLGTNDGEPGTDFQLPSRIITTSMDQLIRGYAVAGPPMCLSPPTPGLAPPHSLCSTEMAYECHRLFETDISLSICIYSTPYQNFLDACLLEAADCGHSISAACKHIVAFKYACQIRNGYMSFTPKCSLESRPSIGEGSHRPIDIVIVVSEVSGTQSDRENYIENLIVLLKNTMHNVQLGIVGYGGDTPLMDALDPTASARYMVALDTIDVTGARSLWISAWKRFRAVVSLDDGVHLASRYPFRLNTQRMIIVVTMEENPYVRNDLESYLPKKNIILNVFGNYDLVDSANKVNGINWDGNVIYRQWMTSDILLLPPGPLVSLVVRTRGAVFHADTVIEGRIKRMKFLVRHMKGQVLYKDIC